jgi:tetratricopeptide (TPR) repeat protein
MQKKVPYRSITAKAVMLLLLIAGIGCQRTDNIDLLSMDLEQYQPVEEFAEAYEALSSQEPLSSDASYDLEQTIRVINAMELAQMHAESFDDFLDYMAKQDYSGVAPDVLEAKRKLFPLLEYTYKLQQQDEQLSNIWMLMRSVASGSESLMDDTSLVELIIMMHSDIFALFHLATGGNVEKSLNEAFEQYEKDTKLKAQVREDLDRLRESYRHYLEYYVPIYKKYMGEYDALCVEKDRAYLDLYGGRADDALVHTQNILDKYPDNAEAMLLQSMGLILESASETQPKPNISMNDIETGQPRPENEEEELPQLPMSVKQRQADDMLKRYTELYPTRTAPALMLEGLLYQQLGDQKTAMLCFNQASVEYPRQAERLTDMLDAYNMRTYLTKTPEGQYLRRLYASTMEGYGLFSPNLQKARYHASQGDMDESRKEIFNHFFRRGNQGIYDELLSDMQFCEENLYGPFKSLLIEQSYIDVSVEPTSSWVFWKDKNEVHVSLSNRSDLRLENVRVFLCIHYTDMYKDEYDVVKVPKTLNVIEPHSTADLDVVELKYQDKDYDDITRIRAIAMTDDRICWIDEVKYKQAKALAPNRGNNSNLNQWQQRDREEYLNNYSLEPQKLQSTLRTGVTVLPPEVDPTEEKSTWKSIKGWFKHPDNTLSIELPRALVMADPVFSIRPLDAADALQPDENYLSGTAIHLHFDYEPKLDEILPLYIYTEAADFRVDILYRGKDSTVQNVTILRQ